jgi:hypothetical protein
VEFEVRIGTEQYGQAPVISFFEKRSRIMNKGSTKPAINKGMPKIKPMVFPFPKVRLMTRPPMNSSNPTAILNEKL